MHQKALADNDFERFRKRTRLEAFLLQMEAVIPWRELCKVIRPFYPKATRKGADRPPVGLERMLRIKGRIEPSHGHGRKSSTRFWC